MAGLLFSRRTNPTPGHSPSDRDLLERFHEERDEASFAELVNRHRGLVMGTCRRVLRNDADAEDAFQATFLVLAKKAGDLPWQPSLAGWLHETARRTALKSMESRARARQRDKLAGEQRAKEAPPPSIEDLAAIVDEELARLPDKFREPLALHLFEDLGRDEVAQRLGLSVAAVKDRLERGRERLRGRLLSRGVTLSAAAVTTWLSVGVASAAAPATTAVASAAAAFVTGQAMTNLVSASALTLAQGVLQMSAFAKIKVAFVTAASVLLVAGVALGMLVPAPDRFDKGLLGKVVSIDSGTNPPRILVELDEFDVKLSLDVDPKAKVGLAYEQGGLDLLRPGQYVSLRLGDDHRTVKEIHARGKTFEGHVVAVDPSRSVLTFAYDDDDEDETPVKTIELPIAKDAIVSIARLPATLAQLHKGLEARIEIGKDGKTIHGIEGDVGEDRRIDGRVVEVDPAGKGLKLAFEKDDVDVEMWIKLAPDALIRIDGKTADVKTLLPRADYRARLTPDGVAIESLSANNHRDDDE